MRIGSPSVEWVLVAANIAVVICLGAAHVTDDQRTSQGAGSSLAQPRERFVLVAAAADSPADLAVGQHAADLLGGELLAIPGDGLTAGMVEDLSGPRPDRVLVLGGPAAVSEATSTALADLARGPVTRHSGADRFATAASVASQFTAPVERLRVMSGDHVGPPGARSAGSGTGTPLLLVETDRLPASVVTALRHLRPGSIEVSGGPDAVSDAVLQQLGQYTSGRVVRGPVRP